jgi:hypothetical protein
MPDPNMVARPKAFLPDQDAGQSITDDNPITICLHAPHHVKEGIVAHLVK